MIRNTPQSTLKRVSNETTKGCAMGETQTQTPCSKVMKPSDNRLDSDLDSTSEVDREEVNGGHRKSNWKDARKMRRESGVGGSEMQPTLEDGAD